jgi:hypothetical protein
MQYKHNHAVIEPLGTKHCAVTEGPTLLHDTKNHTSADIRNTNQTVCKVSDGVLLSYSCVLLSYSCVLLSYSCVFLSYSCVLLSYSGALLSYSCGLAALLLHCFLLLLSSAAVHDY